MPRLSLFESKITRGEGNARRFTEGRQDFLLRTCKVEQNKAQETNSEAMPSQIEMGSVAVANQIPKQQSPLLFCRSLSLLTLKPVNSAAVPELNLRQPINSQACASSGSGGLNQSARARSSSLATSQFWVRQRKTVTDVLRETGIGVRTGFVSSPDKDLSRQKQSDRKVLHSLVKDFYLKQKQHNMETQKSNAQNFRNISQTLESKPKDLEPKSLDTTQQRRKSVYLDQILNLPSPVLEHIRRHPRQLRNPLHIQALPISRRHLEPSNHTNTKSQATSSPTRKCYIMSPKPPQSPPPPAAAVIHKHKTPKQSASRIIHH